MVAKEKKPHLPASDEYEANDSMKSRQCCQRSNYLPTEIISRYANQWVVNGVEQMDVLPESKTSLLAVKFECNESISIQSGKASVSVEAVGLLRYFTNNLKNYDRED